jgi:hypothetical protein
MGEKSKLIAAIMGAVITYIQTEPHPKPSPRGKPEPKPAGSK